jgi:hypothetical protein
MGIGSSGSSKLRILPVSHDIKWWLISSVQNIYPVLQSVCEQSVVIADV